MEMTNQISMFFFKWLSDGNDHQKFDCPNVRMMKMIIKIFSLYTFDFDFDQISKMKEMTFIEIVTKRRNDCF